MNKIGWIGILLVLSACSDSSKESIAAREAALEVAAREAAAGAIEAQSADVQTRYQEAARQAQELMREHAKERLDELLQARASAAKSASASEQRADLDRLISMARKQQQRIQLGRGNEPPKSNKTSP